MDAKPALLRKRFPEVLEDRCRLREPAGIDARSREVVLQLAGGLGNRLGHVLTRLVDVAEIDQLADRLLGIDGIDLRVGGMAAVFAGDFIPRVDIFHRLRRLENRLEGPAVHVAAHGQAEQGEHGGSDVEKRRTKHEIVFFDPRPARNEDPEIAVLGRRAGRLVGHALGSQMIGMEAVVADQDHGRLGPGQLQESAEHQIVVAVSPLDHVLVEFEVVFLHPVEPRRVILHEGVAEVVDGVVVDRRKIPVGHFFEEVHRRPMDAGAFGDGLGERAEPFVFLLIDLRGPGHEHLQEIAVEFVRMKTLVRQRLGKLRRIDSARPQRPRRVERRHSLLKVVRHHRAADRLGRGAWPPADDERRVAGLVEDVPDGLGFSGEIRDRPHGARLRIRLGEAVDAVFIRPLAGGDARPEHRRQSRLERGEVAHHAVLHQPADMGHEPHVDQG